MGPSEFNIVGNIKSWSVVDDLHRIACPVLLISAPQDVAQECAVRPFFLNIAKVKWVELQNSAHFGMYEEPERCGILFSCPAPDKFNVLRGQVLQSCLGLSRPCATFMNCELRFSCKLCCADLCV